MNDQEKILINSYFDGELDDDDKSKAELFLKESREARIFLESLKILQNDLKTFNEVSLNSKNGQGALKFAKALESKEQKKSNNFFNLAAYLNFSFKNIRLNMNLAGSVLSIFFIFGAGFFSNQYYLNSYSNDEDFSINQFTNFETIEKQVFKSRSGATEDTLKDDLIALLKDMLKLKSKSGRLNYGGNSYIIFINSVLIDETDNANVCYKGVLQSEQTSNFSFCKSEKDSFILFSD